jgi:hypothetical protein
MKEDGGVMLLKDQKKKVKRQLITNLYNKLETEGGGIGSL